MSIPVIILPRHEVIQTPQPLGRYPYYTSNGDSLGPLVRGGGTALEVSPAGAGSAQADLVFGEPVEFYSAQGFWDIKFDETDRMSFLLVHPATVVVADAGAGDVNLTAVTGGNRIDPDEEADGSHDCNLSNAVPVLAQDADGNANGYWNVDWNTGVITAVADIGDPNGNANLFDFEIIHQIVQGISMGSVARTFDMCVYRSRDIHPNHKLRFKVAKASSQAGTAAAWLCLFRENTE